MNYLGFKNKLFALACFSTDQVYAWEPDFDRNNFYRWVKNGKLIRLKQGFFTFPEYKEKQDYAYYFANRIYKPSYISLHTALAFYGIIPEAVVQVSSVTPLKTVFFNNDIAQYSYKSIKENLMFGYSPLPLADGKTILMAKPEKALLDLLYLYPEYKKQNDFEELRLDEDFLTTELNTNLLQDYCARFQNKALQRRIRQLLIVYGL